MSSELTKKDMELAKAFDEGRLGDMIALIKSGANPNIIHPMGDVSFLSKAAYDRNESLVEVLLENGASVDGVGGTDAQPLFAAIMQLAQKNQKIRHYYADETKNIVKLLLDFKANPNSISKRGYTPLLVAANYDLVDIVKLLLEAGADIKMPIPAIKGKKSILELTIAHQFSKPITDIIFEHSHDLPLNEPMTAENWNYKKATEAVGMPFMLGKPATKGRKAVMNFMLARKNAGPLTGVPLATIRRNITTKLKNVTNAAANADTNRIIEETYDQEMENFENVESAERLHASILALYTPHNKNAAKRFTLEKVKAVYNRKKGMNPGGGTGGSTRRRKIRRGHA